jgi:hypothetical protein
LAVPLTAAEPAVGATPWTTLVADDVAEAEPQPELQVFVTVATTLRYLSTSPGTSV